MLSSMTWMYGNKPFDESLVGDNWGFIYLIQYANDIWYCGKRQFDGSWRCYTGGGRIVLDYKKKHGQTWVRENSKRFIIEICPTHEIAKEREKHYIARLKAKGVKHWNLAEGGQGGSIKGVKRKPLSAEHKQKIRLALLGKKKTPQHAQKISSSKKGVKGKPHSEETKLKMSLSHKRRYQ